MNYNLITRLVIYASFFLLLSGYSYAFPPQPLYPILKNFVKDFHKEFRNIPEERRYRLNEIANYVRQQKQQDHLAQLLFISTNQSTIGQMAQVWAETAAFYYGLKNVRTYSGGLSPKFISEKIIHAMERVGYIVYKTELPGGMVYKVKYSYNLRPIIVFPKKVGHKKNPSDQFMAIFVEPNAEANLYDINGAQRRLSIYYEDPQGYEGTPEEEKIYDDRCRQIALEMFYVFSQLKHL